MNANNLVQCLIYVVGLFAVTKPVGSFMAQVYEGRLQVWIRWLSPIERAIYRAWGVDPNEEMTWKTYAWAVLWSGAISFVLFYLIQRIQHHLP
ncbi:MAG: potassium-transporting ATPase subunit KdpA, partial [Elusimicrobia bacterium]|nr:potassium-transporting ATPase subunit KdpA [Elusimicrobiota bacterium]